MTKPNQLPMTSHIASRVEQAVRCGLIDFASSDIQIWSAICDSRYIDAARAMLKA